MELEYDSEITVNINNTDPEAIKIIENYLSLIQEEVLAKEISFTPVQKGFEKEWKIQDPHGIIREMTITLQK